MLSSKKDMHKWKFSISMVAILDFFNLNLLSVQKNWHPNFPHPYSILKENQVINHFYQTKDTKLHKGLHYYAQLKRVTDRQVE